jgi:predicted aconitase
MEYRMNLNREEVDILAGSQGETMAKILRTVVDFGEIFGATHLVPVKSKGHLVTSCGLVFLKPVYRIADEIINAGLKVSEGFTVDPGRTLRILNAMCLRDSYSERKSILPRLNMRNS